MTVADFTVQAIVLGVLERYFPHHGFIAEETSSVLAQDPASLARVLSVVSTVLGREGLTEAELCAAIDLGARGHGKPNPKYHWGKGGRTFVLDPIDGTKGFLRGEQFCVALVSTARAAARRGGGLGWVGGFEDPSPPLVVSCRQPALDGWVSRRWLVPIDLFSFGFATATVVHVVSRDGLSGSFGSR